MIANGRSEPEIQAEQIRLVDLQEGLDFISEQLGSRRGRLDSLETRMEEAEKSQPAVAADAEAARKMAEQAREDSIWLSSPLNPSNVLRWFRIRGERILIAILVMASILLLVRFAARKTIQALIESTQSSRQVRGRRAETLARSLGGVLTGLVVAIGIMVVLREAGVDISTVLGGAAIFGVAIAFGAQNLMKDYFNGVMILLEDQYGLNDLVTIGTVEGRVEQVNMRTTVIRDLEGRLHFLPNGQITQVTNRSYEWGGQCLTYRCPIAVTLIASWKF